jgi:Zn ribbon nucleic-acid-binding protein
MTAGALVDAIGAAGGEVSLKGETLYYRLPRDATHFASMLRDQKPDVLFIVRKRGGRVAAFPHCPHCASYALYRQNNVGAYECMTCGLQEIEEATARRLV